MKNFQFNKYMKNFQFSKYCSPAQLYLVLGAIGIISAAFNNFSIETLLTHALFLVVWAWVLNWLCSKGFKAISWILVLLPFIFFLFTYFLTKDVVREGAQSNDESDHEPRAPDPPKPVNKNEKDAKKPHAELEKDAKKPHAELEKEKKEAEAELEKEKKEAEAELEKEKKEAEANRIANEILQKKIDAEIAYQKAHPEIAIAQAERSRQERERVTAAKAARKPQPAAARAAPANAGSSNDTRSYNKAGEAAKDYGVGVGSAVAGGIHPLVGATYDYFSGGW